MKFILVIALIFSCVAWSETYNYKHKFGIGANGGWAFPVLSEEFRDIAEDELMYGFHLRYNTSQYDSLFLNFSHHEFEQTAIAANVYDLTYLYRINSKDKLTPIIGLGAGVADLDNARPYDKNLKFAGRARLGFEYALNPYFLLSVFADYLYMGKMPYHGDDDKRPQRGLPGQEIHAVVPQLGLTLYFDKNE
jgi:hypothetical protein